MKSIVLMKEVIITETNHNDAQFCILEDTKNTKKNAVISLFEKEIIYMVQKVNGDWSERKQVAVNPSLDI